MHLRYMKKNVFISFTVIILFCSGPLGAFEYYVSPEGSDSNPGLQTMPFRTIQKATDVIKAGDTCYLGSGTYRETVHLKKSGRQGEPIRFTAAEGAKAILKGTDVLNLNWSVYKDSIYKARTSTEVTQLFLDDKFLIEARWPNMKFPDELWGKSKWARARAGSRHGKVVDADLAATNINWTGATALLNVAHQFRTWMRPVVNHTAGSDTLTYAPDLDDFSWRGGNWWKTYKIWADDCYYLSGKLEALDSPGEWFYDTKSKTLYLWPPDSDHPAKHTIEVKKRDYGFQAESVDYIEINGLGFFGTAFNLENSNHCLIENCYLLYPFGSGGLKDANEDEGYARIIGNHNTVRRSSFACGRLTGLHMEGQANRVENNIIHDFSWDVSLVYVTLKVISTGQTKTSQGCLIRGNTIYNCGSPCLRVTGPNNIIEYNNIYNGLRGRSGGSKDGALIQTGAPKCAGSVIRYNWVHHALPPIDQTEPWGGGMGIRGDDRTRSLIVHHNVVWKCGGAGLLVKGDLNKVYNNTVLDIGRVGRPVGTYIQLPAHLEPLKPWHTQLKEFPILEQENINSQVFNNVTRTLAGSWRGEPFPRSKNVSNNYFDKDIRLMDIKNLDFRPRPDSKLIDTGRIIPGFTDGYKGRAPDIGAYEFGAAPWKAGADWSEDKTFWSPNARLP
ncbi:MAG: right-handed parallel beta-helix repeat-containing protein [Planctomycetota bacterium]